MSACLMLTAHPPGQGTGSSRRGAVALDALRSRFDRVDIVSFAAEGERELADPAVEFLDRPAPPSPAAQLASLAGGGSFWHAERAGDVTDRVREQIEAGRLLGRYELVWAYSPLMARAALAVPARARLLDIDNVAGNEALQAARRRPAFSPRGALRRVDARAIAREERRRCDRFDQVMVTSRQEAEDLG